MILPEYDNPKTVCVNCWNRVMCAPDDFDFIDNWQESDVDKELMKEFTILATKAAEFLAQGGFFYSWEILLQHIITGYIVYYEVRYD